MYDVKPTFEPPMTGLIKGAVTQVLKRGSVWVDQDKGWYLKDVAYVPNATQNLISLSKLANAGIVGTFFKEKCLCRRMDADGKWSELVLSGDRHNGLWVFNRDAIQLYDRSGKSILRTQRGRYPPEEEELPPPPSVLRLRPSAGDGHEDRGMDGEETSSASQSSGANNRRRG